MANKNGNGSVLQSAVENLQARTERLMQIGKRTAELTKSRAALDAEEAKLNEEIARLTGGVAPAPAKTSKRGRPAGTKRTAKAEKSTTRKTRTPRGTSLKDILLSVMPTSEAEGVTKDAIVALAKKAGWTSKAGDPKIVVGQTLGKFSYFANPSRGLWRLSKSGENAKNKAAAVDETPAAPATAPATTAAPAAPVAPAAAAPAATAASAT